MPENLDRLKFHQNKNKIRAGRSAEDRPLGVREVASQFHRGWPIRFESRPVQWGYKIPPAHIKITLTS
ncbi:hypothetical protein HRbin02_01890 [Candidatus Calditenuaceae archaeon HR02]|nr:hypothetical protein HRbin02_01890 [Candidatus Calditenuaceae archaeon HR02]